MTIKFDDVSVDSLAAGLDIPKSHILRTKLNATQTVYSCTVPMDKYLKAVPIDMVKDHVANDGQRNHVDRCDTSQSNHVKLASPPPQQAMVDVVIRNRKVVNLDAFHRTLTWHRLAREQRPFENIRLTVYVETEAWDMLNMYEVYDSPKAVRTNNHKLSSAYRMAGYLGDLNSLKMRTGKCWSAVRRMFGYKGNQVTLKDLAASAKAGHAVIKFLDTMQLAGHDKLQNVELVAFGNAYRYAESASIKAQVEKLAIATAVFVKTATPLTKVPAEIAGIYRKADVAMPHLSRAKLEELSIFEPITSSRSGEKILDKLAEQLTDAIVLQANLQLAGKRLPVARRA